MDCCPKPRPRPHLASRTVFGGIQYDSAAGLLKLSSGGSHLTASSSWIAVGEKMNQVVNLEKHSRALAFDVSTLSERMTDAGAGVVGN